MDKDMNCKSMKELEQNVDEDLDILSSCGNDNKFSTYVPKSRFMKKNKNVLYVSAVSILLVLLIIILTLTLVKLSNTEPPINLSHALLITSGRNLWAVDSNSLRHQFLRKTKRNIVALDVNLNESILWIERNSSVVSYLNNSFGMPFSEKWEPQAIVVDYVTNKLYVIDKLAGTLNVIDLRHNYTGVVLPDLTDPHDIVLDPAANLIFIIQLYDSILRCDMDGTSLIEMAKNKVITAITINRKMKRIYWLTNFKTIETSNYDGVHHLIIHQAHASNITSLVFHDDKLFWLSTTSTSDKTIVYSCKTNGIHCEDLLKRSVPFSTQTIRAAPETMDVTKKNPCATNNGDCEQLCLLNTNGHSCACKIGFQLNRNMRTCDSITKFLLYSRGPFFRGRIFGSARQTFMDVFSPTRFSVLSLEKKDTIDFDRGWAFDEVYFTDDTCIHRLNLTDGKQTKVYHLSDIKNYHIQGLVIDRRSDNFYFCKKSNNVGDDAIVIITIKEGRALEKTLSSSQNRYGAEIARHSLALHQEFIFYVVVTNGRQTRNLIFEDLITKRYDQVFGYSIYSVLAIDYNENVLYWIEHDRICFAQIENDRLKNEELKCFAINIPRKNVRTLFVYKEWIYMNDDTNIWRFNKNTGLDVITVVSSYKRNSDFKISGVQVSDLNSLAKEKNTACAMYNGGCDQFCSAGKHVNCGCPDGMRIIQDIYCV